MAAQRSPQIGVNFRAPKVRFCHVLSAGLTGSRVTIYDSDSMPNVELVDTNAICSARQLSDVLGLTVRQVHHLQTEGILRKARGKSSLKRYSLAESVQAYLAYQRKYVAKECSKETAAYDSARTRRMAALAEVEEMRLKQLRGELLRRDRIVYVMTNLLSMVKNHMLGLPARCARRVTHQRDLAKVRAILDEDVRNSLREAAQFGEHSFNDETDKRGEKNGDSRNC